MKKFLLMGLMAIILLGGGVYGARGQPADDMMLLKEYILSPFSKELINDDGQYPHTPVTFRTLASEENLTKHDHFDWRYDMHYVTLFCGEPNCFLKFQVKEYQEFVSPDSRGFVLWTFFDYDMDGEFDSVERRYDLVMQDRVVMMPEFPPGFVNREWYQPSKEDVDKRFNKEVQYWLSLVKIKM